MPANLVIVESPAKAKTIEKFLGKDFIVKSSFGHIRDLSKNKLGVDIDKDFKPNYIVDSQKKKVIDELKKAAQDSEFIWLASDEDREGEAIAWHLKETLNLKAEKTKRIVFHEITKEAIINAIQNPRSIDDNLVNAQQARRVLDRLVGFELSPLLWKKVKPSLSAGRVQSVAVRLIVEKENEIAEFTPQRYYRVVGAFMNSKGDILSAELSNRFDKEEDVVNFLYEIKDAKFKISALEIKPGKKTPPPPFTTSTLQQEASRKLGFSVAKTMLTAQKLYESGFITYMRTDSVNLSNLALGMAKSEITKLYGDNYVQTRNFKTKTKGAQEAHEAIRPTYIENLSISGDQSQKKLYELIWKRTIASQMSDAITKKTVITISNDSNPNTFIARGEVIEFDGFLKVYSESGDQEEDEENGKILPEVKVDEQLTFDEIISEEKYTKQPLRYTEASLVKKLEELGIGRPSTYAPTISTIIKREYVVKGNKEGEKRRVKRIELKGGKIVEKTNTEVFGSDKGKLMPTDVGTLVNDFLTKYFSDIIDYQFTANVEKEFDEIASGKTAWNSMIKEFYGPFSKKISDTNDQSEKFSGERLLGIDPKTGKNVYVKIGKYGPIVQIGEVTDEVKPRFAGLNKDQSIGDITIDEALKLFEFPKFIGSFENEDITVAVGRFGPYVKHKNAFFSIPKDTALTSVTYERAIEIILEKRDSDKNKVINSFAGEKEIQVLNGRFGPYIACDGKNYKIPKTTDPRLLTVDDCKKIIESSGTKTKTSRKKGS